MTGLVVAVVLTALTVPIAARTARREGDRRIAYLLMLAMILRLLGALARDTVVKQLYGGVADSAAYHNAGVTISESFRHGVFHVDLGPGGVVGTNFIDIVTGVVYSVIGASKIGGFLVFSWFGFLGTFFFYRAFCIGCPNGDRHRYALLVLFLPSMLFWPSSIGKDAWMMLSVGLAAYGAARLLMRRRGGFLVFALGLAAISAVRPHIAAILVVAAGVAYALRRLPKERRTLLTPIGKVIGIALLVGASVFMATNAQKFLKLDNVSTGSVDQAFTEVQRRTSQGGSAFKPVSVTNPLVFPEATLTVLFRPFPWEGHNLQSIAAAGEGLLLMALFVVSWRRVRTGLRSLLRLPYLSCCLVFTALFIFAFSRVGNFGIIDRERVQMFPFILVFLAMPRPARPKRELVVAPLRDQVALQGARESVR